MEKCKICQSEALMNPDEFIECENKELMKKEGICFRCAFWKLLKERNQNNPNWVIIDGVSWIIHDPVPDKEVSSGWNTLGCGGRKQYIKKNDGTLIYSNNCWCQGDVPKHFKEEMPDNAVFITKEEYEQLMKEKEDGTI